MIYLYITLLVTLTATPAHAASSTGILSPLTKILQLLYGDVSGETGRYIILLALGFGGLTLALTEHGHGARKIAGALVGIAFVIGGVQMLSAAGWTGARF